MASSVSGSGSGERTWTIYVLDDEFDSSPFRHSPHRWAAPVKVVEASALAAEREARERLEEINKGLVRDYNSLLIGSKEASLNPVETRAVLRQLRDRDKWIFSDRKLLLQAEAKLRASLSAVPAQKECTCDRDTLMDGMATPGCPVHTPQPEEDKDGC